MERTLVIFKPDTIMRWISWEIMCRFEKRWLKLVACKMTNLKEATLKEHYSHIADKPFFPNIVKYMTSAPVLCMIWEGKDAIAAVRTMLWVTNPLNANAWTIRWDFSINIEKNVVHASEDEAAAKDEVERFFSKDEIFSYDRPIDQLFY